MTFALPQWLWAFALFPVLLALAVASERRRTELIAQLVAARLAPKLAGTVSLAKRRVRFLLGLLALAGVILALARPQWGFTFEEAKRQGRDVIFAIDTSRSMLADDVKPSRLDRAKLAAQDLIAELGGDRVGVIAFAGTSFLQAPLTVDYTAVLNAVKELDTEVIPQGGSNLEGALRSAREAFGKGESDHRALVIFSDGEELDADAQKALAEFKGQVRVFSVGIGTPAGALIPVRTRTGQLQYVKDETGQPVRTKLDESRLRAIAEATGGFYVHLETGRAEMQRIGRDGLGKMKENDIDARLSRRPIERFQWPLAGALAALGLSMLIGERRRAVVASVGVLAFMLIPPSAHAAWWFKNPGLEKFERGDEESAKAERNQAPAGDPAWENAKKAYGEAHQEFSNQLKWRPNSAEAHYNLGTSAYKLNQLDEAMAEFSKGLLSDRREVQVNSRDYLGNTLYQRGAGKQSKDDKLAEWRGALQQYDEALKLDGDNKMVRGHRDFVQQKIAELEQEQKQDDQQKKDQDQKKDDNKEQKKDDQQQQPNKDQQQKDQEKKDQQPQPQQGQQQDQKQQDGQQQKPEKGDQQKEQQPQPGQDSKEQQDAKPGEQKPGQEKDQKEGDQKQGKQESKDEKGEQGQEKQQDGQQGEKPESMPPADSPKKEGELKGAQPQPAQTPEQKEAAEAQAEAQAVAEGRMSEAQARALLESLKGEEQKVRLIDPRERGGLKRVLKDW